MEIRIIFDIIWRRKWLILQGFFVIFFCALLGSKLMTPVYESSSKVFIQTSETASEFLSELGIQSQQSSSSEPNVETIIEQITLRPLLEQVIDKLELKDRKGNRLNPDKFADSNFIVYKIFPYPYIEVSQVEETNLIEILASSPNREETAKIANTIAECFIQDNLKQRQAEYQEAKLFVEAQIALTHKAYLSALEKLKNFQLGNNSADLDSEIEAAMDRLKSLTGNQQDAMVEIGTIQAKMTTLKQQLRRENTGRISSAAMNSNPRIQSLQSTLSNLNQELAGLIKYQASGLKIDTVSLSSVLSESAQIDSLKKTLNDLKLSLSEELVEKTKDHPDVKAVQEKITVTQEDIQSELNKLMKALNQKILSVKNELNEELAVYREVSGDLLELEQQLASKKGSYDAITKEVKKQMAVISRFPDKQFAKAQYDLSLTVNQNLYSSLLEALYQIGLAQAMTLSDVKLVEPAEVPLKTKIASPNLVLNIILGAFLGAMFGLGLGFLVEHLDDTIKTSDDLTNLGITHLGSVPRFGIIKKMLPPIDGKAATDPLVETYRIIRNSLTFASLDNPLKKLVITSSLPQEGKSSNSVNLAISFAKEKKRILLMDLDLRRPSLHTHFSLPNSTGITSIISGTAEFKDVVNSTNIDTLDVLTTGPVPPDPGAIVESQKMKQMIEAFATQYDMVLMDSPPVFAAFDAITLSKYADGTILILESGKINRKAFEQVKDRFTKCHIRPMGVILNKVKIKNNDYYYYYKSKYYRT